MVQVKCLKSSVIELDNQISKSSFHTHCLRKLGKFFISSIPFSSYKIKYSSYKVIVKFIFITPQILTQNVRFGCSKFLVST